MLTRRKLLEGILASGFCLLPLGRRSWALAAPQQVNKHLVVIFMRGAVDGLSIVTPYKEPNYYSLRSSIALDSPGTSGGVIDLDGFFGLHPSLSPLMPSWQDKTLAFIQASGSPAETRSHFQAQDIMETAILNSASANQGWMNKLAQTLPDNSSPNRALSFGNVLPKIFQGPYNVSTAPGGRMNANSSKLLEDPERAREFGQLYAGSSDLNSLYQKGTSSRESMMDDLQNEMVASAQGAPNADAFVNESAKAGDMIRRDPRIELVFMDVGGWDTHVGQGNAKGQLATKLERLGNGLVALREGMGDEYKNTVILIMSEFGRTVAQNGNNGTDHGHGNVAWLMGGAVKGGRVYGKWPGLSQNQLWQGRDLMVTTDFRSIIGAVVASHMAVDDNSLSKIIPGYQSDSELRGLIT